MNTCSIYESSLETELCLLKISCCNKGVHSIQLCENESLSSSTLNKVFETVGAPKCLSETLQWLKEYFEGKVLEKSPEVCETVMNSKGPFTQLVWKTLKSDVPAGGTITYGALAELCGRSKGSARAVGTAMRTNPVPILVPCHRVVKEGGALGQYSGGKGASTKMWLLMHEGLGVQQAAFASLEKDIELQMAEIQALQEEVAALVAQRWEHHHQRASGA